MRATAAGSLPGHDFRGAVSFILEQFPQAAPLPELPARGPGSDLVGRACALLSGLGAQLTSHGWELGPHSGLDQRRARAQWRQDLDDLEELAQGFDGVLKVSVCGPWTLAALLGRPRAEVALADHGARLEVAQSLQAGFADLLEEIGRRLPMLSLRAQIDEPMLPAVLGGEVATASGYRTLRSVDQSEVVANLRLFSSDATLHCCAGSSWFDLAAASGFAAAYADLSSPGHTDLDWIGSWLDSGHDFIAGVVDTAAVDVVPSADAIVAKTLRLIDELGVDPQLVEQRLLIAPACGLATWQRTQASQVMAALGRASELVTDQLQ